MKGAGWFIILTIRVNHGGVQNVIPIICQILPLNGIYHHIHHLSDPHKGEDGLAGVDAVLYQWD